MSQSKAEIEYIVVSDNSSKVLLSTNSFLEAKTLAVCCRESGGSVTIFKSMEE